MSNMYSTIYTLHMQIYISLVDTVMVLVAAELTIILINSTDGYKLLPVVYYTCHAHTRVKHTCKVVVVHCYM